MTRSSRPHELGNELLHDLPAVDAVARHLRRSACAAWLDVCASTAIGRNSSDFSVAFIVVTLIALLAMVWNARFSSTAGSEISGHRKKSPEDALGGH